MRRQQRVEPGIAFTRRHPRHGGAEAVSTTRNRLDAGTRMAAEQPAQARDRLFKAVVADRYVLPPGLQQVVLGDDLASTGHEQEKDIELPLGNRDRFPGGGQTTSSRIELEGFENEARTSRHAVNCTGRKYLADTPESAYFYVATL